MQAGVKYVGSCSHQPFSTLTDTRGHPSTGFTLLLQRPSRDGLFTRLVLGTVSWLVQKLLKLG